MIENIQTASPVEIDTVLAEIWGRINAIYVRIEDAQAAIREANKMARYGGLKRIPALEDKIEELQTQLLPILAEALPFEAEFDRRGGWTRAFLVNNNNGHVHRSRACSTTRVTTQFMWLLDYSGKNEAQVVADAGCIACTVCYPSAPVEGLAMPTKIFASEEARIKAEKAAAAPADCAGSGTWDYPAETARKGYCSGNYGVCSHCNEAITISSTGKMRKHKAKVAV